MEASGLFTVIVFLAAVSFVIWLYFILPAGMAKTRNRSAIVWILIGIVSTPLLSILLLWALGNSENRH